MASEAKATNVCRWRLLLGERSAAFIHFLVMVGKLAAPRLLHVVHKAARHVARRIIVACDLQQGGKVRGKRGVNATVADWAGVLTGCRSRKLHTQTSANCGTLHARGPHRTWQIKLT